MLFVGFGGWIMSGPENIDTLWRLNHQRTRRWFYQVVWLGPRRICWETRMIDGQSIYSGSQMLASIKIIWESDTDGKSVGRTKRQLTASTKSTSCQLQLHFFIFHLHVHPPSVDRTTRAAARDHSHRSHETGLGPDTWPTSRPHSAGGATQPGSRILDFEAQVSPQITS